MNEIKILNLPEFNDTFPQIPNDLIKRDATINLITKTLEKFDVVFLDGDEGSGKTTLLAEFVLQNALNAISYFITPSSSFTYSPFYLKLNLGRQMFFYTFSKEPDDNFETDEIFSNLQAPFRRQIRKNKKKLYFVFDGLEEISNHDLEMLKDIIDNLPWKQTKFLFSGKSQLKEFLPKSVTHKVLDLTNFGIGETREYFKVLTPTDDQIMEIQKISLSGLPRRLNQIKRICQELGDINKFLLEEIDEKTDLFEFEWNSFEHDDIHQNILALLSMEEDFMDIKTISNILSLDEEKTRAIVSVIKFLQININDVSFISNSYKLFAKKKTESSKEKILSLLIDYYEQNSDEQKGFYNLPRLYQKAQLWQKVTKLLSLQAFIHFLEKSQTFGSVKSQFEFGLNASKKLNENSGYNGDYLKFALLKSSFKELEKYEAWETEVEARIALNEYSEALRLANSTFLKEDRLKLLAILAKARKEKRMEEDPVLIDQIKELYSEIDFTLIKDKGFEIANLLIYCNIDLAIELVENLTNNESKDKFVDYVYAHLSITALEANKKSNIQVADIELIRSKINDKDLKSFSSAFNFLSNEYNVNEIITHAEQLENVSQKLFLLRNWLLNNKEKAGIEKVVEYTLNEIINTSNENVPNATVLAEIATPLPFLTELKKAEELISLFDSQKNTITTPTKDFINLQLILAETLYKFKTPNLNDKIFEIYYLIDELDDLSIKTDCLTLLWEKLLLIDANGSIEKSLSGVSIEKQIEDNVIILLNNTAYHYKMVEFIIQTIVHIKPFFIAKINTKLNTQERRDIANRLAGIFYINKNKIADIDFDILNSFYVNINDIDYKEDVILNAIEKFSSIKEEIVLHIPKLLSFKETISNISNIDDKCFALTRTIKILNYEKVKYQKLINKLLDELDRSWQSIDIQWKKIEIGFLIAREISEYSIEIGKKYLDSTSILKDNEPLSYNSTINTYILSTKLCIKAFEGLVKNNVKLKPEIEKLNEIISLINSSGEKLKLWNEVALLIKASGSAEDFNYILKDFIFPLFDFLNKADKSYREHIITHLAPSIYLYSPNRFFELLEEISDYSKNKSIKNACSFIFTKIIHTEPIDSTLDKYKLDYNDFLNICNLINLSNDDTLIYSLVTNTIKSIKTNEINISLEQKNSIKLKLRTIIDSKLPNVATGISHKGYWIISVATLYGLENYGNIKKEWEELLKESRKITNVSDRALVLAIIAETINAPKKEKIRILKESYDDIKLIPSNFDKSNRLDATWIIWEKTDKTEYQKHLKDSYTLLLNDKDGGFNNIKNLIDVAQQHDEKLAEQFVTQLDQDPHRKLFKKPLTYQVEKNKRLKLAREGTKGLSTLKDPEELNEACKDRISKLHSGKLTTKHINEYIFLLDKIAELPLNNSYNLIVFFIQNAIKKYSNSGKNLDIIQSLFQSTFENAKLVATLSSDNVVKMKNLFKISDKEGSNSNPVFRYGEKELFTNYVKNWVSDNVKEELIFIDPYFSAKDLDFMKMVLEIRPECHITILTSKNSYMSKEDEKDINLFFQSGWNTTCSETPPENRIIVVWDETTGKCPFHDRWLLADHQTAGLLLNSINSIGNKRDTQIAELNEEGLLNVRKSVVDDYIFRKKNRVKGFNLKYEDFNLK
ncbi:MAG: ATP-binding protein [Bacteroidota bacterium]|nr:ATP-binding protein [Bacteroidota bacterium]